MMDLQNILPAQIPPSIPIKKGESQSWLSVI